MNDTEDDQRFDAFWRKHGRAITTAETAIQKILLDLQERQGIKIENVSVDTRNFANLSVEIFVQ